MAKRSRSSFWASFALIGLLSSSLLVIGGSSKRVDVKIVNDPPKAPVTPANSAFTLKAAREPLKLISPKVFEALDGKCFELTQSSYVYRICPFRNVTQKETATYSSFQGILGVWATWKRVENVDANQINREQYYNDGTSCHNKPRTSSVRLECPQNSNSIGSEEEEAATTQLKSVEEYETCKYRFILTTPLACEFLKCAEREKNSGRAIYAEANQVNGKETAEGTDEGTSTTDADDAEAIHAEDGQVSGKETAGSFDEGADTADADNAETATETAETCNENAEGGSETAVADIANAKLGSETAEMKNAEAETLESSTSPVENAAIIISECAWPAGSTDDSVGDSSMDSIITKSSSLSSEPPPSTPSLTSHVVEKETTSPAGGPASAATADDIAHLKKEIAELKSMVQLLVDARVGAVSVSASVNEPSSSSPVVGNTGL